MVRLLIVDDHAAFGEQVARVLEGSEFEVLAHVTTAAGAMAAAGELHPEVVLLDVMLPDGVGFDIVEPLNHLGASVVLTSSRDRADYGSRVSDSGARGFIAKQDVSPRALGLLLTAS